MPAVIIGSDHGGFDLKEKVKFYMAEKGYEVKDAGCLSKDSCDYPDYGFIVAREVSNGNFEKGILICTSGIGMSIVANKVRKVRAALSYNAEAAKLSRLHNNANILVMGSKFVSEDDARKILEAFFETGFEGGRHKRRVDKIEKGEI